MKKISKIMAVCLVCIFIMASLSGCTPKKLGTISDNETKETFNIDTKTYLFYAYNQRLNVENVATQNQMTVEDLLAQKAEVEGFEEQTWDQYFATQVKDQVANLAISLKMFDKEGMTLTAEDQEKIDQSLTSFKDSLGADSYKKFRDALQMTDAKMRNFFVDDYKQMIYLDKKTGAGSELEVSDEAVKSDFDANYARVKHILIKSTTTDATTQQSKKLEGEALTTAQAKADKLFADATAPGANFENLARYNSEDGAGPDPETDTTVKEESFTLSQDGASVVENNGYTFKKGTMVKEFEDAAFDMKPGEIRMVQNENTGWHIMKKYELNESSKIFDAIKDTLKKELQSTSMQKLLDDNNTKYTITVNEKDLEKCKMSKLNNITQVLTKTQTQSSQGQQTSSVA